MIRRADHLTALDQAIGDGDHGLNMTRGLETVRTDAAMIAAKTLPEALKAIGTQLVMRVGGASGPLYGTLLLSLGAEIEPDGANVAAALGIAVDAVKIRGRSSAGQKTMLDVLVPVQAALAAGGPELSARVARVAAEAADSTVPMRATRGRASFLGERSVGNMDPGACSTALSVVAVCQVLGA